MMAMMMMMMMILTRVTKNVSKIFQISNYVCKIDKKTVEI
jgi:hypothetical protein